MLAFPQYQFIDSGSLGASSVLCMAPSLFLHLRSFTAVDSSLRRRWVSGFLSEPSVRETFTWLYTNSSNQSSLINLLARGDYLFPDPLGHLYGFADDIIETLNSFSSCALDYLTPFYVDLLSRSELLAQPASKLLSPLTILCRLIFYPPFEGSKYADLGYRANEHADPSVFTLLADQSSPGLQYQPDTNWIDYLHSSDQSLLMLGQWGSWLNPISSKPLKHRVVFNSSAESRFSLQVFFLGNLNFILEAEDCPGSNHTNLLHKLNQSFKDKYLNYVPHSRWDAWSPYSS